MSRFMRGWGPPMAALGVAACTTVSPTPPPTPTTVPAAALSVLSTEEVGGESDLRYLTVSPDGRRIAAIGDGKVCIAQLGDPAERTCADGPDERVDERNVTWSPDSQRLAFTEDFLRFLEESDIWTLDADSGETRDLTEDGPQPSPPHEALRGVIDLAPTWLPDGSALLFARTSGRDGGTELWEMAVDGTEPRRVGSLADSPFAVWVRMVVSRDGATVYFAVMGPQASGPDNGLYALDRQTGESRRVMSVDERRGSAAPIAISADGGTILVYYPLALARFQPEAGFVGLVDAQSGESRPLTTEDPPDSFVTAATLSPDGTRLLYVLSESDGASLVVRDLEGGDAVTLHSVEEDRSLGLSAAGGGLVWTSRDTIWATAGPGSRLLLQLGSR